MPILFDRNERIKLLEPLVLQIVDVTRHDRGMYQCFVENERENAQGSAELRLGGMFQIKYSPNSLTLHQEVK